jgi:hypothetical protein
MLPELPNETNATWLPAALVDFDLSRAGREYKFEWIPGIVWRAREPENLIFYRSLSQWEELEDVLPLNEDQVSILLSLSDTRLPCLASSGPSVCLDASDR